MAQDAVKNVRNAVKGLGQDGKYFASSKKGEVGELRTELASPDLDGSFVTRLPRQRPTHLHPLAPPCSYERRG